MKERLNVSQPPSQLLVSSQSHLSWEPEENGRITEVSRALQNPKLEETLQIIWWDRLLRGRNSLTDNTPLLLPFFQGPLVFLNTLLQSYTAPMFRGRSALMPLPSRAPNVTWDKISFFYMKSPQISNDRPPLASPLLP